MLSLCAVQKHITGSRIWVCRPQFAQRVPVAFPPPLPAKQGYKLAVLLFVRTPERLQVVPRKSHQLDKSTTKNFVGIIPHKLYMPEVERSVSKAITDGAFGECGVLH